MENGPDVLIVGAGPTGLVLAFWLAESGVKPRIIDKRSGPGEASRAMAVQARTLEFYEQLGIASEVIESGIKMESATVRRNGRAIAQLRLGDIGLGMSPFPFALSFPQDDHEQLLVRKLSGIGVSVEWNSELVDFEQDHEKVRCTIRTPEGVADTNHLYLCGCDGAHSTVREQLGIGFGGKSSEHRFYVADAYAKGAATDGGVNICLGAKMFCAVFPVRSRDTCRLVGILPAAIASKPKVDFEDIKSDIERIAGITVDSLHWMSTYGVHHRVAERFSDGRVFIAGDASHIHSPAGGQGMNTGIGDAVNLAWKIAMVVKGQAEPSLLSTYQEERIPFARLLVKSTDRAFSFISNQDSIGWVTRRLLLPFVAPIITRLRFVRRLMFRTVSQVRIEYRHSTLSRGGSSSIRAGDRLAWVSGLSNFKPLATRTWHIHVYGKINPAIRQEFDAMNLPVHQFEASAEAIKVGFEPDAIYLVRPDGHIGLIDSSQDVSVVKRYLQSIAIR